MVKRTPTNDMSRNRTELRAEEFAIYTSLGYEDAKTSAYQVGLSTPRFRQILNMTKISLSSLWLILGTELKIVTAADVEFLFVGFSRSLATPLQCSRQCRGGDLLERV